MAMKENSFVAFILTHGRPDRVVTYQMIRRSGYTGRIVLVTDNEDKTLPAYREKYGDEVYTFDKKAVAEWTDRADNFDGRGTITFVRNVCFDIAEELGYKYFIELDDDYTCFAFKRDENLNYCEKVGIKDLDAVFDAFLDYDKAIPAKSIAFAQSGDFIGGITSKMGEHLKPFRKAMNTFICSTDRRFNFRGRMNDDVNTYVSLGMQGDIFLTVANMCVHQTQTQKQPEDSPTCIGPSAPT